MVHTPKMQPSLRPLLAQNNKSSLDFDFVSCYLLEFVLLGGRYGNLCFSEAVEAKAEVNAVRTMC